VNIGAANHMHTFGKRISPQEIQEIRFSACRGRELQTNSVARCATHERHSLRRGGQPPSAPQRRSCRRKPHGRLDEMRVCTARSVLCAFIGLIALHGTAAYLAGAGAVEGWILFQLWMYGPGCASIGGGC
jgi:hypothetical protein